MMNGSPMTRGLARKSRALGFTLIEILVAVVILAVALAATTRAAGVDALERPVSASQKSDDGSSRGSPAPSSSSVRYPPRRSRSTA